ncbi:ribonuclease E activity regulator RraA [Vreelandella venusta]|uniref:4-hydroxy-4-methyl-2-oxoglutarate aldolase n=1 Tax=Vreelandella venusta TaxID=44935 RepID=A0AAP9ZFV2_9GAMM|nr:ribonuclease E activity regulator RraA [Halomonas venusta]MBR9926962.1 RraA family protein [Gammaproteobacteria bacterium]AZM95749.1 RraA family protein [Halomonas venusta]MDW0361555.1 ribonuclease E activity regulator RraA [Halomonas venusta]MDX1712919.1 ribonuclease E activity regulator RraA [Halomonas venusta]NPT32790.1 putative 4-hydroxy-4-methyl-2-oxoglutarate aldolase [Halomonas venusta]
MTNMSPIVTPDLCDAYPDVTVLEPMFANYGGIDSFYGPIRTVKCFEDNSLVKQAVAEPGDGAVLVVDAGGSYRCAMLGDMLAEQAAKNGWAGVVMYGCVRDVDILATLPLGVQALGSHPRKSEKRGEGLRDIPITFAGATLHTGQWLYADNNGIIIAEKPLELS